jgi:hypothetical protein
MAPRKRRRQIRSQTQKTKASYATITDLPNEIITIVLKQLAEPDLYSLSFLCRRLHILALPLFLKKRKLYTSDSAVTVSDSHSYADFKAVRLALFVHTLIYLDLLLYTSNPEHTRHLERLMCRMSNVLDVNFYLCSDGSERLLNPLPILLKALENKSCHTMSVTMRGLTDAFISRQKTKLSPITTLTRCRMVGGGHALLRSPWLKWTAESLNGSPVTHLEFKDCTDELANALPLFSLPCLLWLSVEGRHLPTSVFAAFLSRHPTILGLKVLSLQQDVRIKLKLFPSLISLHCNAVTLAHLLAKSGTFPTLKDIFVSDLMTYDTTFITKILRFIRRTRVSFLCTPLTLSGSQNTWLQSFRQPSRRRALATVQLPLISTIHTDLEDIRGFMANLPLWSFIFPNLTTLSMYSPTFRGQSRDDTFAVMEDVFEKCPQIQVVGIDGTGGTLEDWRCGKESPLNFWPPFSDRSLGWALRFE